MRSAIRSISALGVVLVGCSHDTGVLPYGPDTFIISSTAGTTLQTDSGRMKAVVKQANEHCASLGKVMMPDAIESRPYVFGGPGASASFTFRCLDQGDPDLKRPVMRPNPNVRIEDTRD